MEKESAEHTKELDSVKRELSRFENSKDNSENRIKLLEEEILKIQSEFKVKESEI